MQDIPQRAWAIQAYIKAREITARPYRPDAMPDLMAALRPLMASPEGAGKVEGTLRKYGIRLVVLPFNKYPVDCTASENDGQPYVALSLRINRLDAFWQLLLFGLGKIALAQPRSRPITLDTPLTGEDKEADEWGKAQVIAPEVWAEFVEGGRFSLKAVEGFASSQGLHVSLVLGRLKTERLLDWANFARLHPNVREFLPNQ